MLDARILEFNYNFLKNLERKRKMQSSQIRLIAIKRGDPKINKGIGKTYTKQYETLQKLKAGNPILSLSKKEKECQFGDYSIIENIYINNTNLPFPNQFHIYNISGSIRIVDDVQLNDYNDKFYLKEIERFRSLLISIFTDYIKAWNAFKLFIDECYVEACYVDPAYDCGPGGTGPDIIETNFPDLFINAGPDVEIWWPTWLDLRTPPLDSLMTQQGPTHQGCELSREWIITDDDSIKSLKVKVSDKSQLFPVLERLFVEFKKDFDLIVTLTLRVTWPWITLEDSRIVTIKYFDRRYIQTLVEECNSLEHEIAIHTEECERILQEIKEYESRINTYYWKWRYCILGCNSRKCFGEGNYQSIDSSVGGAGGVIAQEGGSDTTPHDDGIVPILTGNIKCDEIYYIWLDLVEILNTLNVDYTKCIDDLNILTIQFEDCTQIIEDIIIGGGTGSIIYRD